MGRRKAASKPQKKQAQKLATMFSCVFCNQENVVSCKLNMEDKRGSLSCSSCSVNWQCPITKLSEPIDVYSEWIDACDQVQQDEGEQVQSEIEEDEGSE